MTRHHAHAHTPVVASRLEFPRACALGDGALDAVRSRLVDLGEDNVTTLKMPAELEADKRAAGGKETVEAAKMATTEMAENAGESPVKVSDGDAPAGRNDDVRRLAQGTDQMRSTVTPPNKGSEDVKPGDQAHATGAGHHMKSAAKRCKQPFRSTDHSTLFFSLQGSNRSFRVRFSAFSATASVAFELDDESSGKSIVLFSRQ